MVCRIDGNGGLGGYIPKDDNQKKPVRRGDYELGIDIKKITPEDIEKIRKKLGIDKKPLPLVPSQPLDSPNIQCPKDRLLPSAPLPPSDSVNIQWPKDIKLPTAPSLPGGGEPINAAPDEITTKPPVTVRTENNSKAPEYNADNPHPNAGKTTTGQNGYSMTVQDDGTYKYYDDAGNEISPEEFRKYNPNMYSSSLTQNWEISDDRTLTHKRGNVYVTDYNYQLIKSYGDPMLFTKNKDGKYVNESTGEVINEYVYNQLCKAYEDITT